MVPLIVQAMAKNPVVALVGSRQVGKTTLAKVIASMDSRSLYLDLEIPSDVNKFRDAELYLKEQQDRLVIIDEVQRMPELFSLLRALVDRDRRPGRFLLLGSSSPGLMRGSSESLAGRIRYFELPPFCMEEVGVEEFRSLWLRGGYPPSFLAEGEAESMDWRRSFIATYLERDIPQLGLRVPASQLRRFWIMLAHLHGQLWNASRIAASMELSAPTIQRYLDILEDTFIIRQLRPYLANVGKRLIKSPKVYVRDSGMVHALLGIETAEDLAAHPGMGASWEGFVIAQVLAAMPEGWQAYYYRTSAGAEIDLVLVDQRQRVTAVEIKYVSAPQPPKGFLIACGDLGCERRFIIYPGGERYPLSGGCTALPIKEAVELF
ncbi:MAG: ATPase AAA [Spirochaetes bacterium]|nr:MAG: ATPase AAA [Spirochaetota bacterium]